jgi:hypothetical protein
VNGLPSGETINISVSGNGEVLQYNYFKAGSTYPSAKPNITQAEAVQKLNDNLHMSLQYVSVSNRGTKGSEWFLGWIPQPDFFQVLDAQTGSLLNANGDLLPIDGPKKLDVPSKEKRFASITGTGDKGLLTAEQAAAAVEQAFAIPEGRKLNYSYLNTYYANSRKIWSLGWTDDNLTRAIVDASTGQVYDFSEDEKMKPYDITAKDAKVPVKNPISASAASEKADVLINILYPNAAAELKRISPDPFAPPSKVKTLYSYNYQRYYNGLPVAGENTRLTLDEEGNPVSYSSSRSPSLEEAVKNLSASHVKLTEDAAKTAVLAATEIRLQYRSFGGYYTYDGYKEPVIQLLYQRAFKDETRIATILDAVSGEWRQQYVGPQAMKQQPPVMPKDIQGHWAQKALETMIQYGILKPDDAGKLNPNTAVSLGDWMNMMSQASNPYYTDQYASRDEENTSNSLGLDVKSPYYAAIQLFLQHKWIDPAQTAKLHPEQILTREQLAASVIRILHYDKLAARLKGKLPLNFQDKDLITEQNSVAIAVDLGIFGGEGNFDPQGAVTKAQAATVLMKLVELQGKLDYTIGN